MPVSMKKHVEASNKVHKSKQMRLPYPVLVSGWEKVEIQQLLSRGRWRKVGNNKKSRAKEFNVLCAACEMRAPTYQYLIPQNGGSSAFLFSSMCFLSVAM